MNNIVQRIPANPVDTLRDPATIRQRAHRLLELGIDGELDHFSVDMPQMEKLADYVAKVIKVSYPSLDIPYHGRWRHFTVGGKDRWTALSRAFSDKQEMVRSAIDLVFISVLLDAGAGTGWRYQEGSSGERVGRSEGLALATFDMFRDGVFSSDLDQPLRVDRESLASLDSDKLKSGFQVTDDNPLAGLSGRLALMHKLSTALRANPEVYGFFPARPGHMFDYLSENTTTIQAKDILRTLLDTLSQIWSGRYELYGQGMGDVWRHSRLTYDDATDRLMPFHKLSQWLTYSLLEPFEWAGIEVVGLDELTGLAEYRNGGLFLDARVINLKDPDQAKKAHDPSDELIVEWRALTVALLDELRLPVAKRLGLEPERFPLARMLEGGTWAAGRKIAKEKRKDGAPPLNIVSDGTVF